MRGPFPVLIAAVGHDDLRPDDLPELRRGVRSALARVRAASPRSPIRVLSPLCTQGERLVARVALESGARLRAVLPADPTLLVHGMSPESREDFASLLRRAEDHVVLDADGAASLCETVPGLDAACRTAAFLARHAQIAIALWDGGPRERNGDPAHAVELHLNGLPRDWLAEARPLHPADRGPVYQVVTARVDRPEPIVRFSEEGCFPAPVSGEADAERAFGRVLSCLDVANADFVAAAGDHAAPVREVHTVVDSLAVRYQKRHRRSYNALMAAGVFAFALLSLYEEVSSPMLGKNAWPHVLAGGYVLVLLGIWVAYRRQRRGAYHRRHLDYRALAEGLRVQLAWDAAGLRASVADTYLSKQTGELRWIRDALRDLRLTEVARAAGCDEKEDRESALAGLERARREWIEPQIRYFRRTAEIYRRSIRVRERGSAVFYVLVVLATLGFPVLGMIESEAGWTPAGLLPPSLGDVSPSGVGFVLVLVCGAAFAARAALSSSLFRPEQAREVYRLWATFVRAQDELEILVREPDLAPARQLIRELGDEALRENADWVFLYRFQDLEFPRP